LSGPTGKLFPEDHQGVRPNLASSTDDVTINLNEKIGKKASARFAKGTNSLMRGSGIGLSYVEDTSVSG
jgi:hypothetical protein